MVCFNLYGPMMFYIYPKHSRTFFQCMVILYKSDIIIYDYECYMKCIMYGDMANVVGCIDFVR